MNMNIVPLVPAALPPSVAVSSLASPLVAKRRAEEILFLNLPLPLPTQPTAMRRAFTYFPITMYRHKHFPPYSLRFRLYFDANLHRIFY